MSLDTATLDQIVGGEHPAEAAAPTFRPMLAHTFRGKLPAGRLFSQPKLDGVRCIATAARLWTRAGNRITSCVHIEAALLPLFQQQPGLILDGELYTHTLRDDLPAIISLVNIRRPDASSRARCEEVIGFHLFDLASHPGLFSERYAALTELLSPLLGECSPLALVETTPVQQQTHLDVLFDAYLAAGYEGQMVRQDAPYEQTRSMRLLKRKPFEDAEFEVVRLIEVGGTHSGYAKRVMLRLSDGRTFLAGIKGSRDYARSLLEQDHGSATVRYSALSPSGIPRSPVAVALHQSARSI